MKKLKPIDFSKVHPWSSVFQNSESEWLACYIMSKKIILGKIFLMKIILKKELKKKLKLGKMHLKKDLKK